MNDYLQVRLAPWSLSKIAPNGKVTKVALRAALGKAIQPVAEAANVEFVTIPNPVDTRATYLSLREAHAVGVRTIEVRYNDDRDLAVITLHPSGAVVVS